MSEKRILVLVGPTAVGKTALSIQLAIALDGEIVSADSVQVYKGLDIGSAKPTAAEREVVRHHMIDIAEPDDASFSVAAYREAAGECINDILSRGKLPIIVGGSGLYVNSLTYPLDFCEMPADSSIRMQLEAEYDDDRSKLFAELTAADPQSAARMHINNKKRVVRALEIYRLTGRPMTALAGDFANAAGIGTEFLPCMIGLTCPRDELYRRINGRVDMMMADGLEAEARKLYDTYCDRHLPAMQAIGYRQLFEYFDGRYSLDSAVDSIKNDTRHFSKRQMTWFKRDDRIKWIDVAEYSAGGDIFSAALAQINDRITRVE